MRSQVLSNEGHYERFKLWGLLIAVALLIPVSAFGWAEPMTAVMKDTNGVMTGVTKAVISEGGTGVTAWEIQAGGSVKFPNGVSAYNISADQITPYNGNKATVSTEVTSPTVSGTTLYSTGLILLGDTGDVNVTNGLVINQGANDDSILSFKSSDVANGGLATYFETDTFFSVKKANSDSGGAIVRASGEDAVFLPNFRLESWGSTASALSGIASFGLIELYAGETNGAGSAANVTANGTVLVVRVQKNGTNEAVYGIDEDGDSWQNGALALGADATAGTGATIFLLMSNSGTTPTAPTAGSMFFSYQGRPWTIAADGTVTQLGMHDPETGEPIFNSYNIYTGDGERINLRTGIRKTYTVDKVNPEMVARNHFISQWRQANQEVIEQRIEDALTSEEYTEKVLTGTTAYVTRYMLQNGTIIATEVAVPDRQLVTKTRIRLKDTFHLDVKTGKVYRRQPGSLANAQQAAAAQFKYDWSTMPKYVRDAWGK